MIHIITSFVFSLIATSESKFQALSTLHMRGQWIREGWGIEARNMTLFRNLAYWENGRLISQNNHFPWVWMPGLYGTEMRRGEEAKKKKKNLILKDIS